ncbi:hypothetical protein BVX98_00155 [bacterium F11]|nr:hypothetical protein BVX98_00155 [bacterium F11]
MAKIFIKFNAAIINEVELSKNEVRFGRKPDNDIVINNPAVSGYHGLFKKEGDGYVVEDLNSTNGTFVNGRRIKKSHLEDNDNIRVAKHILEFHTDSNAPKPKGLDIPIDPTQEAKKEVLRKSLGLPPESEEGKKEIDEKSEEKEEKKEPAPPPTPAPPSSSPPPISSSPPPTKPTFPSRPTAPQQKSKGSHAVIKIVSGAVGDQTEVPIRGLVTYIGSADQAVIKIKGFLAPGLAAAISQRPEGYFLKAVKPGYPKVNGNPVHEQALLESGALIECGGTNMVFYLSDDKKKGSEKEPH